MLSDKQKVKRYKKMSSAELARLGRFCRENIGEEYLGWLCPSRGFKENLAGLIKIGLGNGFHIPLEEVVKVLEG